MIDLHIHTTYSDGSYSLKEILEEAQNKKLEIISITDHDCVKAYNELNNIDAKKIYKGNIITGCEFKCVFPEYKLPIEILGYGFETSIIEEFLNLHSGVEKQIKYLEFLKKVGKNIGLKFDENISINPIENVYASAIFEKEIKKYKENERILFENNVKIETNFYRDAQSNKNSIFFIDETKDYLEPNIIIDLIHKAGGIAFLAHPYIYHIENILDVIENFINKYNIDGLECYYSLFTQEQTDNLIELSRKNNLYISGGTDFHGTNKPNIQLGNGQGNLNITSEKIGNWINKVI